MAVYAGEAELQAKRRTLTVLLDQARRVYDASRELNLALEAAKAGNREDILAALERAKKAEEDVETYRRMLARELASMGVLILNREDFMRTTNLIEELAGYITGIIFRLAHLKKATLSNQALLASLEALLNAVNEFLKGLYELTKALTISPQKALQLGGTLKETEGKVDESYRELLVKIINSNLDVPSLILLKDIADILEETGDRCLEAMDNMTVLSLGL
ncbi:MAG: hypothetical protein C4339_04080 [Nitrososphaerota archaeon]